VFDLVNKFGDEEDQVSACFGFVLKANEDVMSELLTRLGIGKVGRSDIRRIEVETQVAYPSRERIDLRMKLPDKFIVLLESKLATSLGRDQLLRYAKVLEKEKAGYDECRLVYITQSDRRADFAREKQAILRGRLCESCSNSSVRSTARVDERQTRCSCRA